jgi:hypothetical protein
MRSSSRAGSSDRTEAAVENVVAAVGDERLARRRQAQPDAGAERLEGRLGCFQPEGDDLDGHRRLRTQPIHQLGAIDDDGRRRLAVATIFSRSKRAPSPLIRLRVPRSTSSAPSIVRSICRCSANEVSGMPAALACAAFAARWECRQSAGPAVTRGQSLDREAAVEPVPSPTTMPSSTSSTAASAAARLSASRSASAADSAALMVVTAPAVALAADRRDGRLVILRAEDRRAGHDRRGAGRRRLSRRRLVLAAIDLDHRIEAAFAHISRMRRILGSISGKKDWPPKPD